MARNWIKLVNFTKVFMRHFKFPFTDLIDNLADGSQPLLVKQTSKKTKNVIKANNLLNKDKINPRPYH